MIAPLHAALGGVGGLYIRSPGAAFVWGLASHAIQDVIPHDEWVDWRMQAAATGLVLAMTGLAGRNRAVTWGALGAVTPDLEHLLRRTGVVEQRIYPSHRWPRLLHRSGGISVAGQLACTVVISSFVALRAAGDCR